MEVIRYNPIYLDQWDEFVLNHEYSWAGHHSGIFELEKELGGKNLSYILMDEKGKLIGIFPLFLHERKIRKFIVIKTLTSGSSLRSGPLFSTKLTKKQQTKALDMLVSQIVKKANTIKVDNIKIAYPVMHGNKTSLEYYEYLPFKKYAFREGNAVTMIKDLRVSEDELFMSLTSKCRNMIKRGKREGVQFVEINNFIDWMDCYDLNLQTFRTGKTKAFSQKYMALVWEQLVKKNIVKITAMKYKDRIVSVNATVYMGTACYKWMSFNIKPSPIPGISNVIDWETMLLFKRIGIIFYEIGSREFVGEKLISISRFKESFNGRSCYCLDGEKNMRPTKKCLLDLLSFIWVSFLNLRV